MGDSEDAQETRQVIDAVMDAAGTYSTDSDDELAAELQREMEAEEDGDGAGPSEGGGMALQDIQRMLMRVLSSKQLPLTIDPVSWMGCNANTRG